MKPVYLFPKRSCGYALGTGIQVSSSFEPTPWQSKPTVGRLGRLENVLRDVNKGFPER